MTTKPKVMNEKEAAVELPTFDLAERKEFCRAILALPPDTDILVQYDFERSDEGKATKAPTTFKLPIDQLHDLANIFLDTPAEAEGRLSVRLESITDSEVRLYRSDKSDYEYLVYVTDGHAGTFAKAVNKAIGDAINAHRVPAEGHEG